MQLQALAAHCLPPRLHPARLQRINVWSEAGTSPTPNDTSPISGVTAVCASPNGTLGASLDVFPGVGPPDAVLEFAGGLADVTALTGRYLDNLAGGGGTGATRVRFRGGRRVPRAGRIQRAG